jgi:hypothetical protein
MRFRCSRITDDSHAYVGKVIELSRIPTDPPPKFYMGHFVIHAVDEDILALFREGETVDITVSRVSTTEEPKP